MAENILTFHCIIFLFIGLIAGTLISIPVKLLQKKKISSAFTFVIIYLAVITVLIAAEIVIFKNPQHLLAALTANKNLLMIFFAAAAVFALFTRYLFIPVIIFYAVLYFYTASLLKTSCTPLQEPYTLRLKASQSVSLHTVKLPPQLLLPLSKNYLVTDTDAFGSRTGPYWLWLTKNQTSHTIQIPPETLYPAIFTVQFTRQNEEFHPVLKKQL